MVKKTDLFYNIYASFRDDVQKAIRKETFVKDIGQNSWLTSDELDIFIFMLGIKPGKHLLEISCGSGGPAYYISEKTGCKVTGIDINENGITEAIRTAGEAGLQGRLVFKTADANAPLEFDDNTFDALLCIDSMNHYPDRLNVLKEWHRVLIPDGSAVFTDPVVITGPVTSDEIALRSSIGLFLFVPPNINESLINEAEFELLDKRDVSANAAGVSLRWFNSRKKHREQLLKIEGEERFEDLQKFFYSVHTLTAERRLSRIAYHVRK
jgi:SAM-dependent methyltransferase